MSDNESFETIGEVATEKSMQEVTDNIEAKLFGEEGEPEEKTEEEVSEDAEELPEDDDSDSDDEEGSDLDDIADDDEEESIAALLGVDDDRISVGDDGQVLLATKIDGEVKQVPLKDLTASYQLQGHVNNKSMALENERKEFEGLRDQVATELHDRIQGVEALGKALEQQIVEEYQGIDWDRLRVENPSEWTALRQEFAEKAQRVRKAQGLAKEEVERSTKDYQDKSYQHQIDYLSKERESLLIDNPTWVDEAVMKKEQNEIRSFLSTTYDLPDEILNNITDHRLVKIIKDAKSYREGSKAVKIKKEKRIPKFRKPGAAKKNANQLAKARNTKARKAAVAKSGGHVNDIAALLEDRM